MTIKKILQVVLGLAMAGTGVFITLHSYLGVAPWDVLHVGMSRQFGIEPGTAMYLTGFILLIASLLLGVRPGLGTLFDILIVGTTVNIWIWINPLRFLSSESPLVLRIAMFIIGMAITGFGIAIYVGAHLGAGPRDGMMIALHKKFGFNIFISRLILEFVGLSSGLLFHGPVGLGTLLWSIGIGYFVSLGFKTLKLSPQPA